jgi:hypothetical protein
MARRISEQLFDEPSNKAREARALPRSGILTRRIIRGLVGIRCGGNYLDFYVSSSRQRGNLDRGTGRGILLEIRAVCLVYRLEVAEICEKDRCLNDVIKGQTFCSQKGCDVIHYPPGLLRDVAGNHFARLRVERNLAAAKQEASAAHPLRIRADGRRRIAGENGLLHEADCNWKFSLHNGWQRLRSFRLKLTIDPSYNDRESGREDARSCLSPKVDSTDQYQCRLESSLRISCYGKCWGVGNAQARN